MPTISAGEITSKNFLALALSSRVTNEFRPRNLKRKTMGHVDLETYTSDREFTEGLRVLYPIKKRKEKKKIPRQNNFFFEGGKKVVLKKTNC